MDRVNQITKFIKRHDRELYCEKHREGKLCVYRNSKRWEFYDIGDGNTLSVARSTPFFILALTDDWRFNSPPREWGLEPIFNRLKEMDLWNRDIVSDIEENHRKEDLSSERDMKNKIEGQLYEMHSTVKKSLSDINTSTLSKTKKRKGL